MAGTARPGLHAPCFSHPGGPTYAVPQDASSQGKAPAPRATALAEGGCPHPQVLCLPPEDPHLPSLPSGEPEETTLWTLLPLALLRLTCWGVRAQGPTHLGGLSGTSLFLGTMSPV